MTTFDDELSELAAEFLDADIPGYTIGTHSTGDLSGIYTRRYVESDRISGVRPTFSIADGDAFLIAIDSTITVNEVSYFIREKQSDGAGITLLILEG